MKNISKIRYAIFSANQTDKSAEDNAKNHHACRLGLESSAILYEEVEGMYNGEKELSLKVPISGEYSLNTVKTLAGFFKQESILLVRLDGTAYLIFLDGRPNKRLGKIINISKLPEGINSYTKLPDGTFLITESEE